MASARICSYEAKLLAMLPVLLPPQFTVRFQAKKQRGRSIKLNRRIVKMNHMQIHSKPTATESLFRRALKRFAHFCSVVTLLFTAIAPAVAAPNAYQSANFVSDIAGVDPATVNVATPKATPPVPL